MSNKHWTIPECRDALVEIAADERVSLSLKRKLRKIARQMYRRKAVRKVREKSPTFTPELARKIRAYAKAHKHATYMDMGRKFRLNVGRISEALRGTR